MVRFSVITVTLNAEKYLSKNLESVAAQDGVDYEHVIWDGGSSDQTLEMIHRYAQTSPHIQLIKGKDRGIADAMNKGAWQAKGTILIHLHADDFFAHSHVLLMINQTMRLHPEVLWGYGRAHIIDSKGKQLYTTPYERFTKRRMQRYNFITHPACFVSRSLFEKVGGFLPHLKYCMDYDLWLRLSNLSAPFVLNSPIAFFREHEGSLSTQEPLNVTDEAYQVRNANLKKTSLYARFRSYLTWKRRRNKILAG